MRPVCSLLVVLGLAIAPSAHAGVSAGGVEIGVWHLSMGFGFGLAAENSLGLYGVSPAAPIAFAAVGGLTVIPFADLSTGSAMGIETGELLGGAAVAIPLLLADAPGAMTWTLSFTAMTVGGVVGGVVGFDMDPGRHALVRAGIPWGVYLADASYYIVPVTPGGPTWVRYVVGGLLGGGAGIALRDSGITRGQVNLVSASAGVGAVVVYAASSNVAPLPKGLLMVAAPAAGASIAVAGLAAGAKAHDVRLSPEVDPVTGRMGLRFSAPL